MNFADRYFANKTGAWLRQQIAEHTAQLANGMAADYPDYRNRVGYITALNDTLANMQATESEMSARPERQERA